MSQNWYFFWYFFYFYRFVHVKLGIFERISCSLPKSPLFGPIFLFWICSPFLNFVVFLSLGPQLQLKKKPPCWNTKKQSETWEVVNYWGFSITVQCLLHFVVFSFLRIYRLHWFCRFFLKFVYSAQALTISILAPAVIMPLFADLCWHKALRVACGSDTGVCHSVFLAKWPPQLLKMLYKGRRGSHWSPKSPMQSTMFSLISFWRGMAPTFSSSLVQYCVSCWTAPEYRAFFMLASPSIDGVWFSRQAHISPHPQHGGKLICLISLIAVEYFFCRKKCKNLREVVKWVGVGRDFRWFLLISSHTLQNHKAQPGWRLVG